MASAGRIVLEYVCPALGVMIGSYMFSAPIRDLNKAVKIGHLGDLNPTPWAFMLGNCCGWVVYGILLQNLWIFFANAPALVLSVWLNMGAAKLQYQGFQAEQMRQSFAVFLETSRHGEFPQQLMSVPSSDHEKTKQAATATAPAPHETITLIIVVIWLATISLISFADISQSTKELIVGGVVNVNLVFFYGAPLSTIRTVLHTRNSASIHLLTMATNTANGAFWGAYGVAVLDPFVYVPNGLGAALGVVQIFLVLTFPRIPSVEQVQELVDKGQTTERINVEQATIEMRQNPEIGMLLRGDGTDASDTAPIGGDILALSKDRSADDHST